MLSLHLKNNLITIFLVILFAILFGCTNPKNTAPAKNASVADLPYLNEMSFLEVASEYFIEGKTALNRGDSATALRYLETAFMLDTNSKILYNKVIEVAIASGNPASAVKIIQKNREYSQMSDEDLRKIASIYINYRSYLQAFEVVDAIKEKSRTDTLFLMRIAMAENFALAGAFYNAQGKYDSALVMLNKVLDMGIKTPNVLFELGMANERLRNFETAEMFFGEILLIKPKPQVFSLAANYLGYMWADKDTNLTEAEQLILMALHEEPNNSAYLDSYGWVLYRLGRYQEALKQLLLAEEKLKDDYVLYYHLGEVYLQLGDKEKALENFKKANEFEGNSDFEKIAEFISNLSK